VYCNYYRVDRYLFNILPTLLSTPPCPPHLPKRRILDSNLHSPERRLIELRIEHADLDASIDRLTEAAADLPLDELLLRRLKKRRLALRDQIDTLERLLGGKEPA
jgi:hypothetical protein